MKKLLFPAILLFATALAGCGGSSDVDKIPVDTTSVAYQSGCSEARRMVSECGDSTAVQDFLLEFHAATCRIGESDGKAAARDHRQGFEDELRSLSPELAAEIF